ncbi:bifunctional phosphopantothenoylcysteine decarboxylase/phosphopantothenate--cysteine ligase CoaBC [Acaricomes phytoseiuli]|uniref:bifunctional phosphopantothenoylcysteine decarboxylase/phosphopantothenate--cysteine ligase CoaBC n=1 Tax=Acaricomes phytoseiuli TaxID=291968 RepID=UPI000371B5C0|nr:bifunctional phosphopantothenoylcysteine decarboxylase/phosphopantothenate--cysteine ligase CoaBC [Acaricomes phytoseiuli]MCW1249150.1 bifunctional phosphopantothenoylcysteine decarboxylase/phosphopantothenate--cysteine ligase CoaBC [Acaricomes phytoseiuli]
MRIILGVSGGIAAYKAASLLRLFTEAGHSVHVVPTDSALRFVGSATWEALSGHPVSTSVFDRVDQVNHVRLGHEAELIVVAPATADLLAKAAGGHADDLLTTTLLMASGPVVFAPAMHSEMWAHAATQSNVETLRARGAVVIEPAEGRLTGSDSGPGRLPDPKAIYAAALSAAEATLAEDAGQMQGGDPALPLRGRRILVTAGGTRESLDPVRYLGNRSSGKQGLALARAARSAGADVALIAANLDPQALSDLEARGVEVIPVESAQGLERAVAQTTAAQKVDAVLMAAAVADFRPAATTTQKIKKRDDQADPVITLVRTPDILAGLVRSRDEDPSRAGQLIVGFAAETGDDQGGVLEYARAKLERKGCDLLVVNDVSAGKVFGADDNHVVVLDRRNSSDPVAEPEAFGGTKDQVAARIVGLVTERLIESAPEGAEQ